MPGKLSAKASDAVEFLDYLLRQCELLASQIEDFATTKKPATADWIRTQIARELAHLRQRAMVKNLGPLADDVGRLGIQASTSGSQQQKSCLQALPPFSGYLPRTSSRITRRNVSSSSSGRRSTCARSASLMSVW